ncbi:MAG: L,D-transpeptidase family protein [Actinobacteria bacterium]|nr:L,D-transpeptidase family protein [Actinomycetota bacterium]NIW31428.1 L,D-transpeptidase family protein [Actinomycetota bacterium]
MRLAAVVAGAWIVGIACGALANGGRHPDGLPPRVRVDRLVVYKGEGRMEAYAGETLLRTYRVAVGSGGEGDKRYEGDLHTPEGTYRIDSRHHSRDYHRFLHVSYPNREDRRRYRAARRAGEIPEGRGIGGDIGIHGTPTGIPGLALFDWTAGCIAVTNDEAEELYRAVRDDAVIEINP